MLMKQIANVRKYTDIQLVSIVVRTKQFEILGSWLDECERRLVRKKNSGEGVVGKNVHLLKD